VIHRSGQPVSEDVGMVRLLDAARLRIRALEDELGAEQRQNRALQETSDDVWIGRDEARARVAALEADLDDARGYARTLEDANAELRAENTELISAAAMAATGRSDG